MEDFLGKEYYGNSMQEWFIAFAIIIAAVIVAKVLYMVVGRAVKRITRNTKTKLDDIIVDKLEEPLVFALIIIGIWYGLNTLTLSEGFQSVIDHAYYFLIVFDIAWFINRLLGALIQEYLIPIIDKSETDFDDQLLPIAQKALSFIIWAMAIIIGLNNAGYDVGALIAGLGIGGLAFALAAQDSISHLFSGVVIFTDKPFVLNDRVITNDFDGIVTEIGLRSTKIRTFDGRIVTIPNAEIANDAIVNVSSEPDRKVILSLGLIYDTTPEQMKQAMKLLREINDRTEELNKDKTLIFFDSFGDFSLGIKFIYYISKGADIFDTQTKVNMDVLETFNTNGLEFAFPSQTIYNIPQQA
jgi:MscS family membrane protein